MSQRYFLLCQKHFDTILTNVQLFPTFLNFSKKNFVSHVFQVTIILFPLMTTCPKFRSIVTLQVKVEQMLAFFVAKDVSQDNVPSGCINRLILPCREKLHHFCSCHLFVSLPAALPRSKYKCLASGGKSAVFFPFSSLQIHRPQSLLVGETSSI